MKSRNVIISLVLVLALLVFVFIKIRNEPRKKLTFNRNPSRIEYSQYALCRMECYSINANSIAAIFKNGSIQDRKPKKNCTLFTVNTITKQEKNIVIIVEQCGTVARVADCYVANQGASCNCTDIENPPISYLKDN